MSDVRASEAEIRFDTLMGVLGDLFGPSFPFTHVKDCLPLHGPTCHDEGRVVRSLTGMVEACERCRCHEIAWAPYYAELLRIWLVKHPRKDERC